MVIEKYDTGHHSGSTPEARIAARLRNSGGDNADHCVTQGSGVRRVHVNIHNSGGQHSLMKHSADERREAAPRAAMQAAMQKETDK
jgi:hypothetical protein